MTTKTMAVGATRTNHGTQKATNTDGPTKKGMDAQIPLNGKHRVTNGTAGTIKTSCKIPGADTRKQGINDGKLLNHQNDNHRHMKIYTKVQEKEGIQILRGSSPKMMKPKGKRSILQTFQ